MKRFRFALEVVSAMMTAALRRITRRPGHAAHRVVVTGWYGSETVGDIAILGQVLSEVASAVPDAEVQVATFDVARTEASLRQLGVVDVGTVAAGHRSGRAIGGCDLLIFGGGPMMESPTMALWLLQAWAAQLAGGRVAVYACGIGPLRTERMRGMVRRLIRTADLVMVRDRESASFVQDALLPGAQPPVVTLDPAFDHVRALPGGTTSNPKHIALALRYPSATYLNARVDVAGWRERYEVALAGAFDVLAADGFDFEGVVMFEDDDLSDRTLYRAIRARMVDPTALQVRAEEHTVATVVDVIDRAGAVLAVRFHGFVFALARARPVAAIDYTVPHGKTSATADLAGKGDAVLAITDLAANDIVDALLRVLSNDPEPGVERGIDGPAQRRAALSALVASSS